MKFYSYMDKQSAKKLTENVKDILSHAHLGFLNDKNKNIDVNIRVSQSRIKLPANVMVFQAFAYLAAKRLKPVSSRVLMFLFSMTAYENYISMDVKTIAEELDMTERSVINALNELVNNNIVIKLQHPSDKRRHDYFINPLSAWKGNSYTRTRTIKALSHNPNQLDLFNEFESSLKK